MKTPFTPTTFREELNKLLPGYKWTVRKPWPKNDFIYLESEGIQSSGFNRTSTITVTRREQSNGPWYKSKYFDFGRRGPSLDEGNGETLARCIRSLQHACEHRASKYASAAATIQSARKGGAE